MDKKLLDTILTLIHNMEKWSSAEHGLSWRQANYASTLYNLGISPRDSLVQKLFKLRNEHLGDEAGDKEVKLKDSTTILEIFEYVTSK